MEDITTGVKWCEFHHPDVSWPVVRRRAGVELMEMLEIAALFLAHGGWGLLNKACYPNQAAYRNATSRLRKNGLIVSRSENGETPRLFLTEPAKELVPAYFDPEEWWNRKWNGIWYLLVYDVPEVDRKYRNVLRQFLKRMRMGCLQQSVWVTPRDIRPEFDDLTQAVSLDAFAFLFEARTVLGMPSHQVVNEAWNLERLIFLQDRYCAVMHENLDLLEQRACNAEEMGTLMRISLDAYHSVFCEDPLLPIALYSAGYRGREVLSLHRRLLAAINEQLLFILSG